ncbi:MAG TPA: LysR family transcriptional regulator [Bryobacteraceae bacterium]|nr:LysR family transcriptional regulator [Bryobacteraceae bacterium]
MEFRQLELFLAVLDCATVTKAAEKVNLTPGAVSLQLHHLAAELHTDLFVRSGKRLVPTPAALRLAERARAVMGQIDLIEGEFQADPLNDDRPFHFATGATTLIHRLGKPLHLLRKAFPNISINITVVPTEQMVAGLLDRRFDLALISLPYNQIENLDVIPLFDEEMLVLKPSSQRVKGWHVGTIQPAALAGASFVLYPLHSNMRYIIDGFLRELGVAPRVIMEADDTESMKKLVETGFGYSILPEFALRGRARFFQVYRVQGRKLIRTQALAMARTERRRALTETIAQFLRSALAGK